MPSVAIVGGGISGLIAAQHLSRVGSVSVTLFDTGKHGCGGRMSSRKINGVEIDHAAQCFSAPTRALFKPVCAEWVEAGVAASWEGACVLGEDGVVEPISGLYRGMPVMSAIPRYVESVAAGQGCSFRHATWVSRMERTQAPRLWTLFGMANEQLGSFDWVVIAHNGKCAHRLTADCGIPRVHAALKTKFGAKPIEQLRKEKQLVLSRSLPSARSASRQLSCAVVLDCTITAQHLELDCVVRRTAAAAIYWALLSRRVDDPCMGGYETAAS